MFRNMRRFKQTLSPEETAEIFRNGSVSVLAVSGDDGYPYTVPISYVYADGRFYYHCAPAGHKMDAIAACDKASFCVVRQDAPSAEDLTTLFISAVAFGRISPVTDDAEKRRALEAIAQRYFPENAGAFAKDIAACWDRVTILVFEPEHMTGKAAIELINARQ